MKYLAYKASLFFGATCTATAKINREQIVRQANPHRTASSNSTPLQVGNGNFAFGADITGLQTFLPFNTLSTWCWHNSTLPTAANQTDPSDFTGLDWWTHGRLVNYEQRNPAEKNISQWMISNPHRVNLGRIGLWFGGDDVEEKDLHGTEQHLDLYRGNIHSSFQWKACKSQITTYADPNTSTIAIQIDSKLLKDGTLGLFFDYPYMTDKNKFEAPFVGVWNETSRHTTKIVRQDTHSVRIQHDLDDTTYFSTISWDGEASITRMEPQSHRYILEPRGSHHLGVTVSYHTHIDTPENAFYNVDGQGTVINTNISEIISASNRYWSEFWEGGAFIDLTTSNNDSATELQRRIVLSLYLEAVNSAGFDPPQESGLVNNGWYGKFHAEMFLWNLGYWGRWGRWDLQRRAVPGVYERFLPTSIERARKQGYRGARWGKQSDPTGRSAPGEFNSLLIWQQPHPMMFAEYEWRAFPTTDTLEKWSEILDQTADWMADFAFWNESTGVYDLGPPMYPVSENTNPNSTRNPTFELAYWRLGLNVAAHWRMRQNRSVPPKWTHVAGNLAPLPKENESYVIYEGIPDMWNTTAEIHSTYEGTPVVFKSTEDHQSMLGIYGWLPPQSGFDLSIMENTRDLVYANWNFTYSYGWDFPLLAMNAARLGNIDRAIDWLLDPTFQFDEGGYHIGGARVPTPYMPGAASLLWAVTMLAGGWDGSEGAHFPQNWIVEAEGFTPAL